MVSQIENNFVINCIYVVHILFSVTVFKLVVGRLATVVGVKIILKLVVSVS